MTESITYREALHRSIDKALTEDPRVFIMGEDVGAYGGTYAVTKGLLEKFGPERVRDTPLSESGFMGAGVGAAIGGLKPIVEIMTVNFSLLAMDQIVNNAATISHMSGGQYNVPVVIRMSTGAGKQLAAQHSHSWEVLYAHIPGLKVLAPASVQDAYWMLQEALKQQDPVILFEHAILYNTKGELTDRPDNYDPFKAQVCRPGEDVSLITYGGNLGKTLAAAEALTKSGISAEVIDLRSLRPLDDETLIASITKTHRAVVVDEGWRSGSLAAEIIARISETCFYDLETPPVRICSEEVPIPYAKHLEDAAIPQIDKITRGVERAMRGYD